VALSCHIGANLLLPSPEIARSVRAFQKSTRFRVDGASKACLKKITNVIGSSMPANIARRLSPAKYDNGLTLLRVPGGRNAHG
jgi:hypothetical protein